MSREKSFSSKKRNEKIANAFALVMVIIMALIVMLPIWWIFRSSLMSNAELFQWPPKFFPPNWRFSNYKDALVYFPFWDYFRNTMTIIVPSVVGGTITATLGGYAFARLRFPGKKFLFSLCVGSMLLPTMVTLIPLYIMWTRGFHMANTYWPHSQS